MHFRYTILIIFSCCFTFLASAQQLFTVGGTVYKKNYTDRIAQVQITNATKKTYTVSDNFGVFHIKASTGDTLVFKKEEFATQFAVIAGAYDINIYLQPNIRLAEVTIKEMSRKQELNEALGQYRKQGVFSDGKPKALSFLASPITGVYELFGKAPARARKFKEYSKNELEYLEISKKYNKTIVKQLTSLPDNEIEDFMNAFSPSYETVKGWSEYDVITYIKSSFEYYKVNKASMKMQRLY
jgi:hypothetical protein